MIPKPEWDRMTDDDKYQFCVYITGQLEGLIKALRLVSPRNNPQSVTPQETKANSEIQNVDQWLADNFHKGD